MHYFCNDVFQNHLVSKPLRNMLSLFIPNYVKVTACKSKGLSSEEIKPPNISLVV